MISIIYGGNGSGKTAKLIEMANKSKDNAKGIHVYVDKSNSRMHDLDHAVKLVDAKEYGIENESQFVAFIKGMTAGNYDIETIYIDNLNKLLGIDWQNTENIFIGLEKASSISGVDFVVVVGVTIDEMPLYLRKYII